MRLLVENTIIQWVEETTEAKKGKILPRTERVLYSDYAIDLVITINIWSETALPEKSSVKEIEALETNGDIKVGIKDPWVNHFPTNDLNIKKKHRKRRDDAYETIEALVTVHRIDILYSESRGKLIKEVVKQNKTSYSMILKRLRRYCQRGNVPNTLLPDYANCGGYGQDKRSSNLKRGRKSKLEQRDGTRKGINVDPHKDPMMVEYLVRGYRKFHLQQKHSVEQAHIKTLRTYFNEGFVQGQYGDWEVKIPPENELPTVFQFEYWGKKRTKAEKRDRLKVGDRRFELEKRTLTQSSTQSVIGPNSVVQIDATIGDIYLVSSRNRNRIIGRPVIYIVIDVYSRMIVGFAVTLEGPSWLSAMIALESVPRNKVELCEEYGVSIKPEEWPCHYLPRQIIADRGELLSTKALGLVRQLGIQRSALPAYRADWKGIVERQFRTINNRIIKWTPGAVYDVSERGGPDYRLDSTLTLPAFRKLLIHCILHHNNNKRMDWYRRDEFMVSNYVDKYPLDIWNNGIITRSGALKTEEIDRVREALLPTETGSISRDGIYGNKLWYDIGGDPYLYELQIKAGNRRLALNFLHDPRKVKYIYVRHPRTGILIPCKLSKDDVVFNNCNYYEVQDELELDGQAIERSRDRTYKSDADLIGKADAIVEQEKALQDEQHEPMSKAQRTGSINTNRDEEKMYERDEQGWIIGDVEPDSTTLDSDDEPAGTYTARRSYSADMLDMLNDEENDDE